MEKVKVRDKASQFLSQIGTAGGSVGAMTAPGLVSYGAGNIQQQLLAGNSDAYAAQRMSGQGPVVGAPAGQGNMGAAPSTMPLNLSDSYLHLNLPGSPLPMHGLMTSHNTKAAQITQDNIVAMDQRMYTQMMPTTGMLPLSPMQMAVGSAQQLGAQASKQRGRR